MKLNVGRDLYLKGRIGWRGLNKDEYLDTSDYRIINATALMDRYVDWDNCGFISKERYDESPEIMLQENDLLISKDGTLGKIGYVKNLIRPTTVAAGIFVLRNTIPDQLNFDFLYHLLKSPIFKEFIFRNKAMGSTISHLYQEDLSEFEFELPDISVQNEIVDVLNSIDSKIDSNLREIELIKRSQSLLFDRWFLSFEFPHSDGTYKSSGSGLRFDNNLKHKIPSDWEVVKMSEAVEIRDGTHDSPKPCESGYHLITSKHLNDWGIDYNSAYLISEEDYIAVNQRSRVETGDILYSMIGTVGNVYKVEEKNIDFAIKNVALYKTSQIFDNRNYIFMWLKSPYMKRFIEGMLSGSIQKFIGLGDLRDMYIIKPNSVVEEYCKMTQESFDKITALKNENQRLNSFLKEVSPLVLTQKIKIA
ncbi:MAG: restriction endonuclease subunit S [Clostridiales bacterium]|nr:restriction endonuclease subunit S [Clostridiales bacterium]